MNVLITGRSWQQTQQTKEKKNSWKLLVEMCALIIHKLHFARKSGHKPTHCCNHQATFLLCLKPRLTKGVDSCASAAFTIRRQCHFPQVPTQINFNNILLLLSRLVNTISQ